MPLPTPPTDRASQHEQGVSLRASLPRSAQAELHVDQNRDPIGLLVAQNADRLTGLLRLRRQRMSESPFAFFRGAAAVMAADLAAQPDTGVRVAICGDAHLSNFGLFAARDRDLVFDVNDFDETAPGPWEWDLKRLIASVVILGQEQGLPNGQVRSAAEATGTAYRTALAAQSGKDALGRYYTRIRAKDVIKRLRDDAAAAKKVARKATRNTSERALDKLATRSTDGRWQIVDQPPLTDRLPEFDQAQVRQVAESYLASVPQDVAALLTQFTFQDAVLKVVGVGSVGTRCLLALFTDPDGGPLFLQIKEASASVIEQATGATPARPHGRRVTAGQRVIQASGDPFLGDFEGPDGRSYYVRQYRDMKGGIDIATLNNGSRLTEYARLCATALARAHSQSGLGATISGYLGSGTRTTSVDQALAHFAEQYAELNRADHQRLLDAPATGW